MSVVNLDLPDLPSADDPDLRERYKRQLARVLAGVNDQLPSDLALTEKGLKYDPGVAQFLLGKSGVHMSIPRVGANAKLGFDGALDLNAAVPFLGGNLGLDYNRRNSDDRIYLKYQRDFR